jgi:hypothetical protein
MAQENGLGVEVLDPQTMTGSGPVIARLLANGMNINTLRTNDVLRREDWLALDEVIVPIGRKRMNAIGHLVSRGLTYQLPDALGTPVLAYEKESDMGAAHVSMEAVEEGYNDRLTYATGYLPIPIIHRSFMIGARNLAAARRNGHPLDTSQAAVAARVVAEAAETCLINGWGTFTHGGGSLQGYTNLTGRNTGSLAPHWDHSAATMATRLNDVLTMKAALQTDHFYGPYALYVPTAYGIYLDTDYTTYTGQTLRQRILAVDGIEVCEVSEYLSADNVVLVALQPECTRLIEGFQPRMIQWDTAGGMLSHFKCVACLVPQLRLDKDGNSGVAHYS